MTGHFRFDEHDAQTASRTGAVLPDTVFDVHAHLFRKTDARLAPGSPFDAGPDPFDLASWRTAMARHVPQAASLSGLFFPFPGKEADRSASNAWILEEVSADPASRALVLAAPSDRQQDIADLLDHPAAAGMKPYHVYADRSDTFNAGVEEFVPEWMWEVADDRGAVLMLHLVRDASVADPGNLEALRRLCTRYPRAQVVLAHAARAFHGPHAVEGAPRLADLENVWFDTSAVAEPLPLVAILRAVGPRRLMYGSDFPISEFRGRATTLGDGFFWLHPETVVEGDPPARMALCGDESLRALGEAAWLFGLDAEDLADIGYRNARRLLGLAHEAGGLTQRRYEEAKERIPGGVQLLSKRPEQMAPGQWPAYFREARGCHVWDLDGRRYLDMATMGIGACLLGYREPRVTAAVQRRVALGAMSTLNPPEEVALAERLLALHPWAGAARFARTGGEIAAVAVRIARATTGRSHVAVCGYHGWHDWYLAANLGASDALDGHLLPGLEPAGVPKELRGTAMTFPYDDLEAFRALMAEHGDALAVVVMEPCRYHDPAPGFLEAVREETRRRGVMLVFDEITIGWRLCRGGAHLRLGVTPDLAFFAKALGNGHPVAAVVGTPDAMEGAHSAFISSTYWTESVGPTAALATLACFEDEDVPAQVARAGEAVRTTWRDASGHHGLPVVVEDGHPCLAHFRFDHAEARALGTLYTQAMLDQGVLAGTSIYPSLAHGEEHVARHAEAVERAFAVVARALDAGDVQGALRGPVAHAGFRRLVD